MVFHSMIVFSSAGFLSFLNYIVNMDIANKQRWIKTDGLIVKSLIEDRVKSIYTGDKVHSFTLQTSVQQREYRNMILYEYAVGDRLFVQPYMSSFWTMHRYLVEKVKYQFSLGTNISVWYDPVEPWKSDIKRDEPTYVLYWVSGMLVAYGVGRLALKLRKRAAIQSQTDEKSE